MAAALKVKVHIENENAFEATQQASRVKKLGTGVVGGTGTEQENANAAANTRRGRAALDDLNPNRGILRAGGTQKEAPALKDLKDTKLQNVLRNVKARVDTNLKKAPLGSATANGANGKASGTAATATATTAAAATRKVLTRSNSLRSAAGVDAKPKTLASKVAESKVEQTKQVCKKTAKPTQPASSNALALTEGDATVQPLRREDSNLSRKSLTKLKAALVVNGKAGNTATAAVAKKPERVMRAKVAGKGVPTHSTKLLNAVENIDAGDGENLVLVSEYVNDIYDYLYSLEVTHSIKPNHLEGQLDVTPKMRAVLIDWINEVHLQYHLATETFHMAVGVIDRYLEKVKDTRRSLLQLVGITALFLAAKFEELYPPPIADFVYITDDSYSAQEILVMELQILKALDCNLSRPLPIHFLRRYSKAAKAEDCHHSMSKYFLELTAVEYETAAIKPSEIAAASLFLSLQLLKGDAKKPTGFNDTYWTPTLVWYSRYSADHLRPIVRKIAVLARNAPNAKLKAVYNKYQSSRMQKISERMELYSPLMDSIIKNEAT